MKLNLGKVIAYIIKRLKDEEKGRNKKIYGRTYVQKIMYFSLPKNERGALFKAYLYGPYSEGIQRMIYFLENNPIILNKWGSQKVQNDEMYKKADAIIDYIVDNDIKARELAFLSKIHYILNNSSYMDNIEQLALDREDKIKLLKEKSYILGWREIFKNKSSNLKNMLKKLENSNVFRE